METRERQKAKTALKKLDRAKAYEPPAPVKKRKVESAGGEVQDMAAKLKDKAKVVSAKKARKNASDLLL